jgi:hypothetical protein
MERNKEKQRKDRRKGKGTMEGMKKERKKRKT